uniref:ATP-dependent Clp protease n=1 Tax=Prototheca fontanea TaxID=2836215 RepID=UPI00300105E2
MPIGVPKVPFQYSEDDDELWVDLYNRLYRERVLFLCQELGEELSNQLIGIMLYLNAEDEAAEEEANKKAKKKRKKTRKKRLKSMNIIDTKFEIKDVHIYINSPGGSAIAGIALYDAMEYIRAAVNTICAGLASSTATLILSNGFMGNRIALSHSRIMLRQPVGRVKGQTQDLWGEIRQVEHLRQIIGILFADKTAQPLNKVSADLDRNLYLSASTAKIYGLVDKIAYQLELALFA